MLRNQPVSNLVTMVALPPFAGERNERLAVLVVDRDRRDAGLVGQVLDVGGAPGVAAAAPVRVLAGIDEDDAGRAERLHRHHALRRDHAVLHDDLAGEVGRAGRRIVVVAEHHGARRIPAGRRIDRLVDKHQRRGDAVRRGLAQRRGPREQLAAFAIDMGALRQREIELRLVDLDRHAERLEAVDEVLRRAVAVVGMLAADGGEQFHQRPGVVDGGAVEQPLFVLVQASSFPWVRAVHAGAVLN